MATATAAPSNGANGGGGDVSWTSASNITADDLNYAQVSLSAGQTSDWLIADAFGFSIPSGATIDGVLVSIKKYGMGTVNDASVMLCDGTVRTGDDKADLSAWAGMVTNVDYGGSTDDWSAGLSRADVNASAFGVHLKATSAGGATALVGYVEITVYYSGGSDEDTPRIIQSQTSRRPLRPRFPFVLLDLGTDVVEVISAWEPTIVSAGPRRPDPAQRSRVILTDDKLAGAGTLPDTTPGQLPEIIVATMRPRERARVSTWLSIVIDAGSGEVCACPGGGELVSWGYATGQLVSVLDPATEIGFGGYSGELVSSGYATGELVENSCDCEE